MIDPNVCYLLLRGFFLQNDIFIIVLTVKCHKQDFSFFLVRFGIQWLVRMFMYVFGYLFDMPTSIAVTLIAS